jgi:hypothetical protein
MKIKDTVAILFEARPCAVEDSLVAKDCNSLIDRLKCAGPFFPGVPVYLCVFHVLQAWLLKVREKLKKKSLFKKAFGCLHALVYLRTNGCYEERMQAVQQ